MLGTDSAARRAAALAVVLVLDGDPNIDIKNARKISRVMKGGEFIDIPLDSLR